MNEQSVLSENSEGANGWIGLFLALLASSGPIVLAYQCLVWARTGDFPYIAANEWFGYGLETRWTGIREVSEWVMGLPLALFLVLVTFAVGWIATYFIDDPKVPKYD